MAKLSTKKINIADYDKNNQADIAKLARSLNPLMDDLERILRKGLTVEDNLPFQYVTFSCEVDASNIPKTAIKLNHSLTTTIKGGIIVNAYNSNTYPNAALGIVLSINGSNVEVKRVYGIPANTKFDITVMLVS